MGVDGTHLRCVLTGEALVQTTLHGWANRAVDYSAVGVGEFRPTGLTRDLLATADGSVAYPIVNGVPMLLAPEAFTTNPMLRRPIADPRYSEAYAESDFYNQASAAAAQDVDDSEMLTFLSEAARAPGQERYSFPDPPTRWLTPYSSMAAQHGSYQFLAPIRGKDVLQIGGTGTSALTMLLAGAEQATLISPMIGELILGRSVADRLGLSDRFQVVCGIAEELPFARGSFDRAYSGSCMHHTTTEFSFREISRVLKLDGKFASVDVYAAPLHGVGTKVFGKAERGVNCTPLSAQRVEPVFQAFADVVESYHGAIARYPLAIAQRLGRPPNAATIWRLAAWEDKVARRSSLLTKQSSLVALHCAGPIRAV